MASNSFGTMFRITTWGESHGPAVGVVIDGCPAGVEISIEEVAEALARRAPGKSPYTSPRKEPDEPEILSGLYEGKTTGAPICILVRNCDADSSKYAQLRAIDRPGHADFTYRAKYGHVDLRGGGRSSARETVGRVAAGAFAKKLLSEEGISITAELVETGDIEQAMAEGDSVGGIVQVEAVGLPIGLGDPVYNKLEAELAAAMLSLPASKGFEIGKGFDAARMRGSEHNDCYSDGRPVTNSAGGVLGGISTGEPLVVRVAFKPTSSIQRSQHTAGREFALPTGSRHDPCVAIRAVPVVEAMCALVLADRLLVQRASSKIALC